MNISDKNKEIIKYLNLFCILYISHRDFILYRNVAKHKGLNFESAEVLSSFINQIVTVSKSEPSDFMSTEDERSNDVIDAYTALKECKIYLKDTIGAKAFNDMYKCVKRFYRKKVFCYEMDSNYPNLVHGFKCHIDGVISFNDFYNNYCYEISLFTGKRKPIDLRKAIRISRYILDLNN